MHLEFEVILTILGVSATVIYGYISMTKNNKADIETKSSELAIISQKLDTIGGVTNDVKHEMESVHHELTKLTERIILVEQSTKSAHHRIDGFETTTKRRLFR